MKLQACCSSLAYRCLLVYSLFLVMAAESAQYVIFHVDAISTPLFMHELQAGNLPNIESFFGSGSIVPGGLSLWPGGTEIIYPRLKPGYNSSLHANLGWQYLDRSRDRWVWSIETAIRLYFELPRRSRLMLLHAHPPELDILTTMSMRNIPALLDQYDALEIFWFATDHAGHVSGRSSQLASLYRFDRGFGRLLEDWQYHDVNVILYSDHGMSFDNDFVIPVKSTISSVLESEMRAVYYPNVYLSDPSRAPEIARKLIREVKLDWVFYRIDPDTIKGLNPGGEALIQRKDEKFAYTVIEGEDPFAYDEIGYQGEWLDHEEWLGLTIHTSYPGAIPNLYWVTENPNAGDLIMVMNPPIIPQSMITNVYNHKGLSKTDLQVPLAFRGPRLEHLYNLESIWLHELYSRHVPDIPFDQTPARESHRCRFMVPLDEKRPLAKSFIEARFSPGYRLRMGASHTAGQTRLFGQYDILSSFLTRVWLGVGGVRQSGQWKEAVHSEVEWQSGRWGFGFFLELSRREWDFQPRLAYYSRDFCWSAEISSTGIGFSRYW